MVPPPVSCPSVILSKTMLPPFPRGGISSSSVSAVVTFIVQFFMCLWSSQDKKLRPPVSLILFIAINLPSGVFGPGSLKYL